MFEFIPYFIEAICSNICDGGSEKDKKGLGVQVPYRRWVKINFQTDNLLMFDAEMGIPKYFRKFYHELLIDFDL